MKYSYLYFKEGRLSYLAPLFRNRTQKTLRYTVEKYSHQKKLVSSKMCKIQQTTWQNIAHKGWGVVHLCQGLRGGTGGWYHIFSIFYLFLCCCLIVLSWLVHDSLLCLFNCSLFCFLCLWSLSLIRHYQCTETVVFVL